MAYQCDQCGKGVSIGRNIRHKKGVAGGRWKKRAPKTRKVSLPNLQSFKGVLNGQKGKWRLCTKCLKIVKKSLKAKGKVGKVEKKAKKSSPGAKTTKRKKSQAGK